MVVPIVALLIVLVVIGYVIFGRKSNKGNDVPER